MPYMGLFLYFKKMSMHEVYVRMLKITGNMKCTILQCDVLNVIVII